MEPKKVLVLCTGNSCRSQMAEAYLQIYAGKAAEIFSAGIESHGLNAYAVQIMKEDKIDISNQSSNKVDEYQNIDFDYIITVCDHAEIHCPVFPSKAIKIHQNFKDPAKAKGSEIEILAEFLKVRNQIKDFCKEFVSMNLADEDGR